MINLKIRKMVGLGMALSILWMTSCSTKDKENTPPSGGRATVKINFRGDDFEDDPVDPKAFARSIEIQKTTVLIDPSTYIEVEVTPDNSPKKRAVIPTDRKYFRVMAFQQNTQKCTTYQDYYVQNGTQIFPINGDGELVLEAGVLYTMVAYSFGELDVTNYPNVDPDKYLFNTKLVYNYATARDFMYFSQNFTPTPGENSLNILFKHKVAQFTATITATDRKISEIKDIIITPNYQLGEISLSTGTLNANTSIPVGKMNYMNFIGFGTANIVSDPIWVNGETSAKTGTFEATYKIDNITKTLTTLPFFNITRGARKNLNINFKVSVGRCRARVSATEVRDFMCHNLGADMSADPFTGTAAIHGAKYKWGAATGEPGHYLSQEADQKYATRPGSSPPDYTWDLKSFPIDGGWDASSTGGPKNPCPSGYRLPTSEEWKGVFNYNKWELKGSWPLNQTTEYSGGILVTDPDNTENKMFLPAAGFRSGEYGTIINRSHSGEYMTCETLYGYTKYFHLYLDGGGRPSGDWRVTSLRSQGNSVRCIKDN